MPIVHDWILLVLVVAGLGARAWFGIRALRSVPEAELEARRRRAWARGIASQWALVAILALLWTWQRRTPAALGLVMPSPWGLAGVGLGLVFVVAVLGAQRWHVGARPELASRVRAQLVHLRALLPNTRAELPGFVSLAITAGVCEEVLFRGFVMWLLACVLPAFWMAALAQALLFGLAHAYQGPSGVLRTGAVGMFMAGLVWVTGSLWAAMVVHALMDIHAGDMAVRVFGTPEPPAPA